jgi:hypothetical protein
MLVGLVACRVAVAYSGQLWLQPHARPGQEFAPDNGGNTAVAQAIALLNSSLQQRDNSKTSVSWAPASPTASQSSATSNFGTGAFAQQEQQRVLFVAVQQATMGAAAAPSGRQKLCWRVTMDNTNRPGPICPGAPRKPLPAVVLVPVELGSAASNL